MIRQLALAVALMTSATAQATEFNFSFSDEQILFGSETVRGTGLLTATETATGVYIITALTGILTVNGSNDYALSLTAPGTAVVTSSNDNVLQFPAPTGAFEPTFFDERGLGFDANGVNYDLYGIGEGFTGYQLSATDHIPFGAASVSVAAVPEPATWVMMLLGFCGLALVSLITASRGKKRISLKDASSF